MPKIHVQLFKNWWWIIIKELRFYNQENMIMILGLKLLEKEDMEQLAGKMIAIVALFFEK